jgi:hypothetical protein
MKTRDLVKLHMTSFLALITSIFLNTAFSIEPVANSSSLRYTTALIKVNITSQNYYSACVQGVPPPGNDKANGIWGDYYSLCPTNSFQSSAPSVDSASTRNCVCGNACSSGLSKYGNAGLKVSGIQCTVPVSLWLPNSIFANQSGATITLFGTQVYASNSGGTQVFIQPSASTDTFYITVDSGTSIIGPDAAFLQNFLTINMFQNKMVTFQGCGAGFTGC